jgi:hypothetical protein
MSENCVRGCNSAVTRKREVDTSAHAMTFDSGNDGSGIDADCVHQLLADGGERVGLWTGQGVDLVQIGADRKKLSIAGDDQWANPILKFQLFNSGDERRYAGAGQPVGAVKRDQSQEDCRPDSFYSEERGMHANMMRYRPVKTPSSRELAANQPFALLRITNFDGHCIKRLGQPAVSHVRG